MCLSITLSAFVAVSSGLIIKKKSLGFYFPLACPISLCIPVLIVKTICENKGSPNMAKLQEKRNAKMLFLLIQMVFCLPLGDGEGF